MYHVELHGGCTHIYSVSLRWINDMCGEVPLPDPAPELLKEATQTAWVDDALARRTKEKKRVASVVSCQLQELEGRKERKRRILAT